MTDNPNLPAQDAPENTPATPIPDSARITVDVSSWNMAAYADFVEAIANSDTDLFAAILAECVTSWPYDLPPRDLASYDELMPDQWNAARNALRDGVRASIANITEWTNKDFQIDLSAWKMKTYRAYWRATNKGDIPAIIDLMAGVVKGWPFGGVSSDAKVYYSLTPRQWMAISNALGAVSSDKFR